MRPTRPAHPPWSCFFFFQAEDGIRDKLVTGVQTCALPICCLLLEAGSPVEWETTDEPAEGILEIVAAWRRGGEVQRDPVGGFGFSAGALWNGAPAKMASRKGSLPPVLLKSTRPRTKAAPAGARH